MDEKKENIMMGVSIAILVFLIILVIVFIYLAAVYGTVGTKINNGLDMLEKKFGKLTTALGDVSDVIADGVQDVLLPALKDIGPEVKGVFTSSVNLTKEYLTLGKTYLDNQMGKVQSDIQQVKQGLQLPGAPPLMGAPLGMPGMYSGIC